MRSRPLSIQAIDLWLLADAAAQANLLDAARGWADRAWESSGPTRYREVQCWLGVRFALCTPIPRGFVYYAPGAHHFDHHVLVHPDAESFVAGVVGMRVFMTQLLADGQGLHRMEPLLASMLGLEAPEGIEYL